MQRKLAPSALLVVALACAGGAFLATRGLAQEPGKTSPTWAPGGKHQRFTPDNCVFAFIDHQTGLMNLVHNTSSVEFKSLVIGLAKTA